MTIKNNNISYGTLAKFFHWTIALLIIGLLLVGLYMGNIPNSPFKFQVYMLHKSFGLTVLWLAGLRILWRFYTHPPPVIESQKSWEKLLAKLTHTLLYIAMFGMPLSGWVMSSAGEHPVPYFGLMMPDIVGKNHDLAGLARDAHGLIANILIAAILLHAAGAFKHHIIDRDMTLNRMIPNFLNSIWPLVLMVVVALFGLGVVGIKTMEKNNENHHVQTIINENAQTDAKKIRITNEWKIVQEQSQINFTGDVYNKKFEAHFSDFDGSIIFDPNNLTTSRADIDINLKTVNSADAERDANMMGADWFNVADFPVAEFHAAGFEAAAEGQYVAIGDLTLAGKTMPLTIPFGLDIVENDEGRRAYVEGQFTINRLDYDLGGEKWRATDIVGQNILVNIRLVAEN